MRQSFYSLASPLHRCFVSCITQKWLVLFFRVRDREGKKLIPERKMDFNSPDMANCVEFCITIPLKLAGFDASTSTFQFARNEYRLDYLDIY